MTTCVPCSADIQTRAEAVAYYLAKLAGSHTITCRGNRIDIVFEREGTHLFSQGVDDINAILESELVTRNIGGGKRDCRRFCLDRARLMDFVLPAISNFIRCTGSKGAQSRQPREVHGPKMACGRHMKVVLRGGPGKSWVCLSAYPIDEEAYRKTSWQKPAKFP